jgi:hypothetical protein
LSISVNSNTSFLPYKQQPTYTQIVSKSSCIHISKPATCIAVRAVVRTEARRLEPGGAAVVDLLSSFQVAFAVGFDRAVDLEDVVGEGSACAEGGEEGGELHVGCCGGILGEWVYMNGIVRLFGWVDEAVWTRRRS